MKGPTHIMQDRIENIWYVCIEISDENYCEKSPISNVPPTIMDLPHIPFEGGDLSLNNDCCMKSNHQCFEGAHGLTVYFKRTIKFPLGSIM